MNKFLLILIIFKTYNLFAQDEKVFDVILKDQKRYLKKHIVKEEKKNYKSIINAAYFVRPKVFNEISKENLSNASDINII